MFMRLATFLNINIFSCFLQAELMNQTPKRKRILKEDVVSTIFSFSVQAPKRKNSSRESNNDTEKNGKKVLGVINNI